MLKISVEEVAKYKTDPILLLDPVHKIPARNETVTKLLRLGLVFTRYEHGRICMKPLMLTAKSLKRNDKTSVLCEQLQHRDDFMPV